MSFFTWQFYYDTRHSRFLGENAIYSIIVNHSTNDPVTDI